MLRDHRQIRKYPAGLHETILLGPIERARLNANDRDKKHRYHGSRF
jgi:hypothetical protein